MRPLRGAQIDDLHGKLITIAPVHGARINDINLESLIREGSGNDAFRFPMSKKPLTDFLRPYQ